jgi:hypothetical protein
MYTLAYNDPKRPNLDFSIRLEVNARHYVGKIDRTNFFSKKFCWKIKKGYLT